MYCTEPLYLCTRIRITSPLALFIMIFLIYILCAFSFIPEVLNEKR